jgi:hypothetical protein
MCDKCVKRRCWYATGLFTVALWVIFHGVLKVFGANQISPLPVEQRTNLGWNLAQNTEYSTDGAWADVTNLFLPWGKVDRPYELNPNLAITDRGYPLADAAAFSYLRGYPKQKMSVIVEGGGAVLSVAVGGKLSNLVLTVDPTVPGMRRGMVDYDPDRSSTATITLRAIDPNNPVTNLQILSVDSTGDFTNQFIAKVQTGCYVRFMDWQRTNHFGINSAGERTPDGDYSVRPTPETWNQVGPRGVALEYMISLCNTANVDPWFCIPTTWTDDDVRDFARLVRVFLNTDKSVYKEYSNETWNSGFRQQGDMRRQAAQRNELTATNDNDRLWQFIALRTVEIEDIFRSEFGTDQGRTRNIYAGQAANPGTLAVGLSYLQSRLGVVNRRLWGLSVARYFGNPEPFEYDPTTQKLTHPEWTDQQWAEGFIKYTLDGLNNPSAKFTQFRQLANDYGLVPVAYEGGQSITDENTLARMKKMNSAAKKLAQHLPGMADVYIAGANAAARDIGPTMFGHYQLISPEVPYYWGAWASGTDALEASVKAKALIAATRRDRLSIPQPRWAKETFVRSWTPGSIWGDPSIQPPAVVLPPPVVAPRKANKVTIDYDDGQSEELQK